MKFNVLYNIVFESDMVDSLPEIVRQICQQSIPEIQSIYDAWDQNADGFDEEFGNGGICDEIANVISGKFSDEGFEIMEGGQDGDDHAYIFVGRDGRAFEVDVPPSTYEYGGGYSWKKRMGVVFEGDDFYVNEVSYTDVFGLNS